MARRKKRDSANVEIIEDIIVPLECENCIHQTIECDEFHKLYTQVIRRDIKISEYEVLLDNVDFPRNCSRIVFKKIEFKLFIFACLVLFLIVFFNYQE